VAARVIGATPASLDIWLPGAFKTRDSLGSHLDNLRRFSGKSDGEHQSSSARGRVVDGVAKGFS